MSQPFLAWGDDNYYFALPNGSCESQSGWNLQTRTHRSSYSTENEPWQVEGSTDRISIQVPMGGGAQLAPSAVPYADQIRFFVRSPGVGGVLRVHIEVGSVSPLFGQPVAAADYTLWGRSPGWQPTPGFAIPDRRVNGYQTVSVEVSNSGLGSWKLDDVLMDPWRAG